MVLALSDESPGLVEPYVAQNDLPFAVAAESRSNGQFSKLSGARSIPHSYLLDHEGKVLWHGHPNSLSKGKIEKAIKAAPRLANALLALPFEEAKGSLGKAYAAATAGNLGDALTALARIQTDERSSQADRDGALAATERLESHVATMMTQIEKALERRDVLAAVNALDTLADDLKGHAAGTRAAGRLDEITKDETLANEIQAAEALGKAMELGAKRGMKKARGKLESVIKKFPGTKAAERARSKIAGM